MNNKLNSAVQVLQNVEQNNLRLLREDLKTISEVLIYFQESLAASKIKVQEWRNFGDTLMSKYGFHLHSLLTLLEGTEFKSKYLEGKRPRKILDVSSGYVLLRVLFECYLVYHHIYLNPKDEEEKKLRYYSWILSGLNSRSRYSGETSIAINQKKKDALEIEKLKGIIKALPAYRNLTPKRQGTLLTEYRSNMSKKWSDIMVESGIGKEHQFHSMYSFLSSHAHSEGISIIQYKELNLAYSDYHAQGSVISIMASQLTAKLALTLVDEFRIIEIVYNTLPNKTRQILEIYRDLQNQKALSNRV